MTPNKVNYSSKTGNGLVMCDGLEVQEAKDSHVEVFVLDSLTNLKPLTSVSTVNYAKDALKVLCIGSSYGVDGTRYVPYIAKSAGKKVVIANLYYGGCTLAQHDSFSSSNTANYTYYKNAGGVWTTKPSETMLYGLKDEDWDIITIQMGAGDAGSVDVVEPYLTSVVKYINDNKTNKNAKLYWHLTWAYRDGGEHLKGVNKSSSEELYNAIINTYNSKVKTYVDNGTFAGVIPTGTAVQNARQNADLYSWNSETETLTDCISRDDTTHLSYEYGRYLAGLVWAKVLADVDVDAASWTPAIIGYEVENAKLALIKAAAKNAVTTPLVVTKAAE